jgi:hypothetical protein
MTKPTTLVSQLNKMEAERKINEAKEDEAFADRQIIDGKVWVRLIRPCYDSEGRLHTEGITALRPEEVPSSAKFLSKVDAQAAAKAAKGGAADEDDDK